MNCDKNSFLAGLAVGRQLKGWSAYPGGSPCWSALAAWRKTEAMQLGSLFAVPPYKIKDLGYPGSEAVVFDMQADGVLLNNDFYGPSNARAACCYSPLGKPVFFYTYSIGSVPQICACSEDPDASAYLVSMYAADRRIAWGNTWRFGTDRYDERSRLYSARSRTTWASSEVPLFGSEREALDAVRACLSGSGYYKLNPGPAVSCFVKYLDADDGETMTPVLISHRKSCAALSADGSTETTYAVSAHEYEDEMYFYMSTLPDGETADGITVSPGVQLLDLTGGGAIAARGALFAAVAEAAQLAVTK